jgi:hypothetical protein
VELGTFAGEAEVVKLLDMMQAHLARHPAPLFPIELVCALRKLHRRMEEQDNFTHPLFKTLVDLASRDIYSGDVALRLQALRIFHILSVHMVPFECIAFSVLLLADPHPEIRRLAPSVLGRVKIMCLEMGDSRIPERRAPGSLHDVLQLPYLLQSAAPDVCGPLPSEWEAFLASMAGPLGQGEEAGHFEPALQAYLAQGLAVPAAPGSWSEGKSPLDLLRGIRDQRASAFAELATQQLTRLERLLDAKTRVPTAAPLTEQLERQLAAEESRALEHVEEDMRNLTHLLRLAGNLLAASGPATSLSGRKALEAMLHKGVREMEKVGLEVLEALERQFYYFDDFMDLPIACHEQ